MHQRHLRLVAEIILFANSSFESATCTYVDSSVNNSFNVDTSSTSSDSSTDTEQTFENISDKNPHKLRVYYTNADCLLNKLDELKVIITLQDPDIIIVTEAFPKTINPTNIHCNEYKLSEYNCFSGNITESSRGVLIYVKDTIPAESCHVLESLPFKESTWCELRMNKTDKLLVGGIYKSPNSEPINQERLLDLFSHDCIKTYKHCIILGDFNYPGINWENWTTTHNENHIEYKFIEQARDNFMFQHVHENTRYRHDQVPSLLDLVFSNQEDTVENLCFGDKLGASDHISITFDINCDYDIQNTNPPRRNFFKGDYPSISKYLGEIDWNCMDDMNVNCAWSYLLNHIHHCIEKYIPMKVSKGVKPKPRWMDSHCVKTVKKKYHAWKRYTYSRSYRDYQDYCRLRNKASKAVHYAKRQHEKGIASSAKLNPKSFWAYIREQTKTRSGIGDLKTPDGRTVTDDKEKAEVLNNFFSSVFTVEGDSQIPDFDDKVDPEDNINIMHITPDQVLKLLKSVETTKACGPDNFHPMILKECADQLCVPLCTIFSKSVTEGHVPTDWKMANVTCIFKKGIRSEPGNYRPISLTSIVCKLLEKLIRESILNHLTRHNLLSDNQYGFRGHRNTILQLLTVLEDWTSAIDSDGQVDTVYLDFAKAFDTVPHKRLLCKLKAYGISGQLLSWIEDFLSNRKQRVNINGNSSGYCDVVSGVPQGSILGPLLFVIYINDVPDNVKSSCYLFADDTKLYNVIRSEDDQKQLQSDIFALCKWSSEWMLRFNVQKCKVLNIGQTTFDSNYQMLDKNRTLSYIINEETEKDLGVHFTSSLNFELHISKIVNKANSIIGLIKRNFSYMDKQLFLCLYKALVRPHLDYGNLIYFPTLKKLKQAVENVQRRATRIVPELKGLTYEERLEALNLPTLEYRRLRGDQIQLFKIVTHIDDIDYSSLFTLASNNQVRGHSMKLLKPRANKTIRLNSFTHRVINNWNALPEYIVTAKNVNQFKSALDKLWRQQRFDTSVIY